MSVTGGRGPALPAAAQRLRLLLWDRSQKRLRDRYGWDLSAPDAVERARALLAGRPADAEAQLLLAAALSMAGDEVTALEAVRQAALLDPGSARVETTLATLLVQRGEREDGLNHARRAADLDHEDPHVLYNLGLAEHSVGDRQASREAFVRAGAAIGVDLNPWWRRLRRR